MSHGKPLDLLARMVSLCDTLRCHGTIPLELDSLIEEARSLYDERSESKGVRLTIEQIREIGNQYFPDEDWDTANEEKARLAIAQRCFQASETEVDGYGQYMIYTSVYVEGRDPN